MEWITESKVTQYYLEHSSFSTLAKRDIHQNGLKYSGDFVVNYSSIDVNLHLNNANYPMLVQDVLYQQLQKSFNFKKFQISFNIACKLGEKIRVFYKIENQEFKVAGLSEDNKIIFESAGSIEF